MSLDCEALQVRLRALFLDELDEHVIVLNRGLVSLEQGSAGADFTELVNEMFRSAHSLKGAAQAAAVKPVATLCHGLEASLARLRDRRAVPEGFALEPLFQAVDTLAIAAGKLRQGGDVSDLPVAPIVRSLSADGADRADRADRADEVPAGAGADRAMSPRPEPVAAPAPAAPAAQPAQAPAAQAPAAQAAAQPAQAGIRVPAARLEALLGRAGEVLLACERMHGVAAEAASPEAAAADRVLVNAQHALADALRQAGMVPFSEACAGLERVTRDVANAAGKQAALVVKGGEVEMDRPVLAGIREPLLHLVRNAVDHGIEAPGSRLAAGKPASGTVSLEASLRGVMVAVTVSDDGAGIDSGAVKAAAARRGISSDLDDDGDVLRDLVFTPGVSTAPLLTEVSGRGVGLDAVRAGVEAIGGSVAIESTPGAGSCVTLLVPVTRSVARIVLVAGGQEMAALPTSGVLRMARFGADDLRAVDDRTMLLLGERLVPVAWLADALGAESERPAAGSSLTGVVVETPGGEAVLVVDQLIAEQEAVIKPPPARLSGLPGVLGTTILPTGQVVVVVNPATCVRMETSRSAPLPIQNGDGDGGPVRPRRVLLADDTLTTRTLERSILETAGYEVVVAVDGMNALELLEADGGAGVDAVVSDVNMPRMDGLSLCEALRASNQLRHLPVVLVTSLASEDDRRRGVEAGADAYIAKSEFDQSMLLDTLARLL
ncbi:MAG TPA: response regulator [Acidimicrobiales bacterium]|nr:response regulator [Acidimicrobiales bacterium]